MCAEHCVLHEYHSQQNYLILQEDIKCLETWAADWQMNLCYQMLLYEIGSEISTRPDLFDYTLHDQSFIFPLTGFVSLKVKQRFSIGSSVFLMHFTIPIDNSLSSFDNSLYS